MRNISAGCQVSNAVILSALTIEYAMFFLDSARASDRLLLLGFVMLTYAITCNNHERSIHLEYERELALMLKAFFADLIMGVFGTAVCKGADLYTAHGVLCSGKPYRVAFIHLILLHLLTVFLLCVFWNLVVYPGKRGSILYIYEKQKPPSVGEKDAVVSVTEDAHTLQSMMDRYERIYLYDMSAIRRNDILKYCFAMGKDVYITAKLSDVQLRYSYLTQNLDCPIYYSQKPGLPKRAQVVKRVLDIMGALLGLLTFAPVFLLIVAAIKIEDQGPVFFRQTRCTVGNRCFQIIKFRSMVCGAEESGGPMLADYEDIRITRVGRMLRKCKLDELPQLFNILKGDMSFVGPRPERPELIRETVKHIPEFAFRTSVKAGLTGYAQVHGDYHTDFLEKLKWDLIYIENYSLILDIKILLMTIPAILHGDKQGKRTK